ncbi:MAG: hypothetical protein K8J09_13855, partial [Planctomycetes bacterium]|nr:hypothetical protein [Planctomycetota bacterium]
MSDRRAATSAHALHRIDLVTGAHTMFPGSEAEPLVTPVGVALDGRGQVFVSDSSRARIVVFDTDGSVRRAFGDAQELGRPTGLAWDAGRGRLLAVDTTGN